MGPRVDSVPSDQALPTRVDVVIVGGGIIGTSTALFLARKGVSVALCEKGHIAHEQSSRNWGWCRKMARDPRELPLAIESLRIWEGMNEMVEAETGFRSCGIIYLAETQADLARFEDWLDHARQYQLDSRIIGSAEIARRLPGIAKEFAGALFTASDGKAEPQMAAPAIARAARRHGATILTSCAVRGIETAAGHVVSVVTERSRIACDSVVLAGGAWSRLFCGNLGIELPQLSVLSSVMRTERLDSGPEISAASRRFGYRKRMDGGYTVSTAGERLVDLVPDSFVIERARASIAETFPAFRNIRVAETWAGMIDVMPDAIPVISAVDKVPGFFIATGFSGHGFGIGPGAGRLIADMVTGAPPIVDPAPFRLSRFTDGSNPRPHPLAS